MGSAWIRKNESLKMITSSSFELFFRSVPYSLLPGFVFRIFSHRVRINCQAWLSPFRRAVMNRSVITPSRADAMVASSMVIRYARNATGNSFAFFLTSLTIMGDCFG